MRRIACSSKPRRNKAQCVIVVAQTSLVQIARNESNEFSLARAERIGPWRDRVMRGIRAFLSPTRPIRAKVAAATMRIPRIEFYYDTVGHTEFHAFIGSRDDPGMSAIC